MARRNKFVPGWIVLTAIIAAVTINIPGWAKPTLVALGIILVIWAIKSMDRSPRSVPTARKRTSNLAIDVFPVTRESSSSGASNDDLKILEAMGWIERAGVQRRAGNLDACREDLNRAVFLLGTFKDRDQSAKLIEAREALKALVSDFCSIDPQYQQILTAVKRKLDLHPGALQSDFVKNSDEEVRDPLRRALYFADLRGEIEREKFGRSYRLYLPGQERLSIPPRPRKKKEKSLSAAPN